MPYYSQNFYITKVLGTEGHSFLVQRERYIDFLMRQKDKDIIKIITWLRRSGKSTLLFQLYFNKLLETGIAEDHIIRIALDNIRNAEFKDPVMLY